MTKLNNSLKQSKLSGTVFIEAGFNEIILPSLWEMKTFIDKTGGSEILSQMWNFTDKGNREVCLIPEVTGVIQELYEAKWTRLPKPIKLFYVQRCYRYERPQKGRYREFTQLGIEILKGKEPSDKDEAVETLKKCLNAVNVPYRFVPQVKRGLTYYVEDGFEVECESLGAQKQIAGGGRYKQGIGWAIGIDRLMLAKEGE